jgi:hypothetical protein
MNPRFLPNRERDPHPGLEKHHKLMESPKVPASADSDRTRESIPTNWFYNERRTKEVWDGLEELPASRGSSSIHKDSPYQRIEEAAARIRNTIAEFELQDQQFLLELMEIIEEESCVETLDCPSLLNEARFQLVAMIEEHVDFAERQSSLLRDLTAWFQEMRQRKFEGAESDFSPADVVALRALLTKHDESHTASLERAELLHLDVVHDLQGRVTAAQRAIAQKDFEMAQLAALQEAHSQRGRSARRGVNYSDELSRAQRVISELQGRIATMRQALQGVSSVPADTADTAQILEGVSPFSISIEKELELDSRLRSLHNQVVELKKDNKFARDQMFKARQNELTMEKRMQGMEKMQKTAEVSLQAANKKFENMTNQYEKQIADLKEQLAATRIMSESPVQIKLVYEKRLVEQAEQLRKQAIATQDTMEKRFKSQLREIVAACGEGDVTRALDESMRSLNEQVENVRIEEERMRNDIRQRAESQFRDLVAQYETILSQKNSEIERTRNSVESEAAGRVINAQIENQEMLAKKFLELNEIAAADGAELRRVFADKVDELKQKLMLVSRERDQLRQIIGDSDTSNEEEEHAHEEEDQKDDALQQSLDVLKARDIENTIAHKYALLMQTQKSLMADATKWEVGQAQSRCRRDFDSALNDFRRTVAAKVQKVVGPDDGLDPNVRTIFIEILSALGIAGKVPDALPKSPAIPLDEVDARMSGFQAKVLELAGHSELWRETLANLGSLEGRSSEDIMDALKQAITSYSDMVMTIQKESRDLRRRLGTVPVLTRQDLFITELGALGIDLPAADSKDTQCDLLGTESKALWNQSTSPDHRRGMATSASLGVAVAESLDVNPDGYESVMIALRCSYSVCIAKPEQIDGAEMPQPLITVSEPPAVPFSTLTGLLGPARSPLRTLRRPLLSIAVQTIPIRYNRSGAKPKLSSLPQSSESEALTKELDQKRSRQKPQGPLDSEAGTSLPVDDGSDYIEVSFDSDDSENDDPRARVEQLESNLKECRAENDELARRIQRMSDLKEDYLNKIEQLNDRVSRLQDSVLAGSIEVAQDARALPSVSQNLGAKKQAMAVVAQNVSDLPATVTSQGKAATRDLTDVIHKASVAESCSVVDVALDVAEQALRVISEEPRPVGPLAFRGKITALQNEMFALRQFVVTHLREQGDLLHRFRAASRRTTSHLRVWDGAELSYQKQIASLTQALHEKSHALSMSERKLRKQRGIAETLQENLRQAISQLQTMTLERKAVADEMSVLQYHDLSDSNDLNRLLHLVNSTDEQLRIIDEESPGPKSSRSLVSPFVIFSTGISNLNRGFSLMPLSQVFQQTPRDEVRLRVSSKPTGRIVIPRPQSSIEDSRPISRLPRSLSFEHLIPISDGDTTGSLIAYVTRYVNEMSPEARRIKPQKSKPITLVSPSVLGSEVPRELLRIGHPELPRVTRPPKSYEQRIRVLKDQLTERNSLLEAEQQHLHDVVRELFTVRVQLAKSERLAKKNGLLHDATRKRLTEALDLLKKSNKEIVDLKKMLRQADEIKMSERLSASPRADREMVSVFRKLSHGLSEMSAHEFRAVRKWAAKKDSYLENERTRLLATLEAMHFVTEAAEPEQRSSMLVLPIPKKKKTRTRVVVVDDQRPPPTADAATVIAASHIQEVSPSLQQGIIGSALS